MSKDTLSARLNQRITVETPTETPDGSGGFTTSWDTFVTIWAEVKSLGGSHYGSESFGDGKLQSRVMYRFTVRMLDGVTAEMRISWDGRLFNIRAIRYPDAGRDVLEILAEEGVAV